MRLPSAKTLFPPLALSAGQEEQYERLAHSLVKEAVADYDHFWTHDQRVVDPARWKVIKRRDSIVVYRDRGRDASVVTRGSSRGAAFTRTASAPPAYYERASEAPNPLAQTIGLTTSAFNITERSVQPRTTAAYAPKLLAVGSLTGSLDDVMYGITSPNASSMRLKTSYLDDAIVDGTVLYQIQGPSASEPFRFLGIKWLLQAAHGAAKAFVRPRDVVVLEYATVMCRPSGERIGVHVVHSIDVPACRELTSERILRAKVSSCYLYRELPNGAVDLYMTATVEPRGHVLESLAVRSAANALSSCWQAVACAQSKKLAWRIELDRERASVPGLGGPRQDTVQDAQLTKPSRGGAACSVCHRAFSAFAKPATCQLCHARMCYRCRVVKTLSSETLATTITKTPMVFCTACIASVSDASAAEIATCELYDRRARARTRASSSAGTAALSSLRDSFMTSTSSRTSLCDDQRASERSVYAALYGEPMPPSRDSDGRASYRRSSREARRSSTKQPAALWRASKRESSAGETSMRSTSATDALTLVDVDVRDADSDGAVVVDDAAAESPVLLNERVTCSHLRAMDYIHSSGGSSSSGAQQRSSAERDRATATAAAAGDEEELVSDFDDDDDGASSRQSFTSSIALLDHADDDEVELLDQHDRIAGTCVEEGDEDAEDTASRTRQERISQVHALVRAQSAGYERTSARSNYRTHSGDGLDPLASPRARTQSYQMQLWMQMTDLRDVAESTYQVAKRTTETVLSQQHTPHAASSRDDDAERARKLRAYSQPFQFNVVGLRGGRSMTTVTAPTALPVRPSPLEFAQYDHRQWQP